MGDTEGGGTYPPDGLVPFAAEAWGVQEKLAITTCDCSSKGKFFKFTLGRMRFFENR